MTGLIDRSHRAGRNARRGIASAVAAGLLLVACGSDDHAVSVTGRAPDVAETPKTVEVNMVDYKFENLPAAVAAGTKFTVTNESKRELHEFVAIRLDDSETRTADQLVKLPEAQLATVLGGEPATVLLAAPNDGKQIDAVGDGTLTEPGRYLIICAIPTGADPQAYLDAAAKATDGPPQVAGGPPHFAAGMYGEVTVEK